MTISSDRAKAIACEKYREIYPEGVIPEHLEDHAFLDFVPGDILTMRVTFCVEGKIGSYCLFEVTVDRVSGDVVVQIADDWHRLESMTFVKGTHVT